MNETNEVRLLKHELIGMFGHIQRIRRELASIRRPGHEEGDHFSTMADQLDAIVEATEEATDTIMTNMEEIDALIVEAKGKVTDADASALLGRVGDKVNAVFEACSFQDLTGQRVTKVVQSLQFIEERVNTIIRMWGRAELEKVVIEMQAADPDKALLNGPQRKGAGVSQSEIDRLFDSSAKVEFNQDDIDKLFG